MKNQLASKLIMILAKLEWLPSSGFGKVVLNINDSKIIRCEVTESKKMM